MSREIYCPDGCIQDGGGYPTPHCRLIEQTEPDASGEYKDVCTCDECGIIFYIVRARS